MMSQKGDVKDLIEQQALAYSKSGVSAGGLADKDGAAAWVGAGGVCLMYLSRMLPFAETQLRTMVQAQAMEIKLLKDENVELLKEIDTLRKGYGERSTQCVFLPRRIFPPPRRGLL